jgi:hypothetical protein
VVPLGKPIVNVRVRVLPAGIAKRFDHINVEPESAGSVVVAPLNKLVFAE